jgi:hypothetical protein
MLESRDSETLLEDKRSDENRNEGGASGLVFKTNVSDWNFRPPLNVFWLPDEQKMVIFF